MHRVLISQNAAAPNADAATGRSNAIENTERPLRIALEN
jgi:hypothetical protein